MCTSVPQGRCSKRLSLKSLLNADCILYKEDPMPLYRPLNVSSVMIQLVYRFCKDICNFVDLLLSGLPVTDINSIADAGKECLLVT